MILKVSKITELFFDYSSYVLTTCEVEKLLLYLYNIQEFCCVKSSQVVICKMKAVELSFEEEKLIRTEWIRKDEVEDFIIDCAHFYDHETVVVTVASILGLDYKRLKIDMWDRRLKTQGNPQWYCKH